MATSGLTVGVVIQNPEPDERGQQQTELQWANGGLSGLINPADLVKPTEGEVKEFKQSSGYEQYQDRTRRKMKEEVGTDNRRNEGNSYWGQNMLAKVETSKGVWKVGRILNDHEKGLIGEELQFGEDRKVTTGEVQLLFHNGELSAPIRISRLGNVDETEKKQFRERVSFTYGVQREDDTDPERARARVEALEAKRKRENEEQMKRNMRQHEPLEGPPEQQQQQLLETYIHQHQLGTDLVCSTDGPVFSSFFCDFQ